MSKLCILAGVDAIWEENESICNVFRSQMNEFLIHFNWIDLLVGSQFVGDLKKGKNYQWL